MTNISKPASFKAFEKKKLLIVDDSDFIRVRLAEMFDDARNICTVLQAKDSAQAYTAFNSYLPEIVILDIHIPGDNGIKILEKFKKIRPQAKIIMLTNYPYDQYRKRCMELGADYFFEKSGDMEQIVELCEKMCLDN